MNRYTANLNTSFNLSKQLTLNLLSNASYRKQRAPAHLAKARTSPTGEVSREIWTINPLLIRIKYFPHTRPNEYYTRNYADFNIFHELDNNYIELNIVDLKFQGELKWKPISELEFSALGAMKYSTIANEQFVKDDANQANAYRAMGNAIIRDQNDKLYTDPR